MGWAGHFEEKTGVACHGDGVINGKNAWLLHCPWINGTGISFQQFTFKLPKAPRVTLTGFTAIRAESIGKSDGATFRVYVDGKKLLDVNRTDEAWKRFSPRSHCASRAGRSPSDLRPIPDPRTIPAGTTPSGAIDNS